MTVKTLEEAEFWYVEVREYSHWLNIEQDVENENPVCILWDHNYQWREFPRVTEEVSDQEQVVLLTSEQEQAKR